MKGTLCAMGGIVLGGLFLLALIFGAGILLFHVRNRHGRGATQALQILDERLARGEIDQEDYQERRSLVWGTSGGTDLVSEPQ